MKDPREIIDKYYPADAAVRGILIDHSLMVAAEALGIADRKQLPLEPEEIILAAMLHDIGIVFTDAEGIACYGSEPYIRHGVLGAELLRREGVDEKYARVAERHTGAGLTHEEISGRGLSLPLDRSYMPETLLEKLICYADCFWSKPRPKERKTLDRVRAGMARHGSAILSRFEALHEQFG